MSANIDSMMYTGEAPWHGLGTKVDHVATAAEAIVAAGLNWSVKKEQVYLKDGQEITNAFATIREDNKAVLGIVGRVYRPLQNREAFSFFDAVVGTKEAIYHTAGALGNGSPVWLLAKLPGYVRVIGEDVAEKFILLTNSHDGKSAIQIMFTPIRVVCQNTLNIAIALSSKNQHVRHTASLGLRVRDVQAGLGIVNQQFEAFEQAAQALTKVQLDGQGWRAFCRSVGIIPADEHEKMSRRTQNIIDEVTRLFEYGKGNALPGVKGTAWAAFNAVTDYVDHVRPTRHKQNDNGGARVSSLLFGSGAILKQRAWDAAVSLISA